MQELGRKIPHTTEVKLQGCRYVPKNILKETTPPQMLQTPPDLNIQVKPGVWWLDSGPNLQPCFFQWWIHENHSSGGGWVALRATDHEANGWNGGPTDVFTDVKSHIERSSDFFRKNTWDFFSGAIFFRKIEHESRIAMFCSSL